MPAFYAWSTPTHLRARTHTHTPSSPYPGTSWEKEVVGHSSTLRKCSCPSPPPPGGYRILITGPLDSVCNVAFITQHRNATYVCPLLGYKLSGEKVCLSYSYLYPKGLEIICRSIDICISHMCYTVGCLNIYWLNGNLPSGVYNRWPLFCSLRVTMMSM